MRKRQKNIFDFRRLAGQLLLVTFFGALSHVFVHDLSSHQNGHFNVATSEQCLLGKTPAASVPVTPIIELPDFSTEFVSDLIGRKIYARVIRQYLTRAPPLA